MRTGLPKQKKVTDIWFDEKDPLIHIRTHNTDLKKRLAAYAEQHPDVCRQTDADPETGCMEFDIEKGRFSFRLTAPYSEERREAARRYARESNVADRLKLNPLIRGWRNYFQHGNSTKRFKQLDEYVWMKLWRRVYYRRKQKKYREHVLYGFRKWYATSGIEYFYYLNKKRYEAVF